MKHLLDGAERMLVLRTFLGEREHIHTIPSCVPQYRDTWIKYNNQYSFQGVLGYIEGRGFKTRVHQDEYLGGAPQFVDQVVRTFYVICAERRSGGPS